MHLTLSSCDGDVGAKGRPSSSETAYSDSERGSILVGSQLPSRIAVEDCAAGSDNKRIAKRHFAKSDQCRKLGGRHRELMPEIAGMGSELAQIAKHKPGVQVVPLNSAKICGFFWRHLPTASVADEFAACEMFLWVPPARTRMCHKCALRAETSINLQPLLQPRVDSSLRAKLWANY